MKKLFLLILCLAAFSFAAKAVDATIWETGSRTDFLRGEAKGVSVTDTGAIIVAPKLSEIYNTSQSFVWSSAVDGGGNVFLGTGNDGRLFKVDANGKSALFTDFDELQVSAIAIGKSGEIYAATSPDGKVYRVDANGKAEVYFDPNDKYIWSLAVMNDGSLAVGTGENGKIYRVKTANAKPEDSLLYDSSETHIISLALDKSGNLIAGTDSNGVVLRVSPEGKAFAILDAPLREIHQLSVANDGSIYALALSDSASSSTQPATSAPTTIPSAGATTVTVTNVTVVSDDATAAAQAQIPPRSRNDLSNTKSAVFKILPDGGNEIVWSSTTITAFSVVANPNNNGVLIGTSDKGRIYSVTNDGRETLLTQSNEGQISTIKTRGADVFATSSNGGKLFKFNAETVAEGSYESIVRDAKFSALWGRIWWRANGNVEFQTHTGNTDKPDTTWSDWQTVTKNGDGGQIQSPKARYLQWRVILRNAANISEVSVSYLPRNIAPEITNIQISPTNVGLQSNATPPNDPNIESSGVDPSVFGAQPTPVVPPRKLYQRGAVSIQWTAEDRNSDKLEYSVYYRAANEQTFILLKDKLRDNFYTIDGATLSDGRFIVKIVVNDSPSNPLGQGLSSERISEPFDVDNTSPTVQSVGTPQLNGDKIRAVFDVNDTANIIRKAEVSVDGGDWRTAYSDDGISDSPHERYTIEVTISNAGEHTISLRAFDANGNVGNVRVNVRR